MIYPSLHPCVCAVLFQVLGEETVSCSSIPGSFYINDIGGANDDFKSLSLVTLSNLYYCPAFLV